MEERLTTIKWLDSCSYMRIEKNSSISEVIQLGNIENGDHQMYEKPAASHKLSDESVKTVSEINY